MIAGRTTLVFVVAVIVGQSTEAQVRASERGRVAQVVDGTWIELDYGRPRLRGRTAFGGVIHWGEIWTPGANFSTTIRFAKAVKVSGHSVPAGRYSMWLRPTETEWTLFLHRNSELYHLQRPRPEEMFVAIPVTPTTVATTDRLTFSFPEVRRDGTILELRWGDRAISVDIQVPSTAIERPPIRERTVSRYLGLYTAWVFGETRDSTAMRWELFHEDGKLKGRLGDGRRPFELIPTGKPHQFWFEVHDQDGPVDLELTYPIVFTFDRAGRVIGFRMQGIEQPLWIRGERNPA